jgi:hypothetical protein
MQLFLFPVACARLARSLWTGSYAQHLSQVRPWFPRFAGPPK